MICECQFDKSVHLGMVNVFWHAPSAQNVEQLREYDAQFWRNETLRIVGSKLALRSPSMNFVFMSLLIYLFPFQRFYSCRYQKRIIRTI